MPAAVFHNDTALSFAYAINAAQDAFTINRDAEKNRTDGFLKASAKVVTRVPVNMTLSLLASIETVVKAILTGVFAILYPITDVPYNYFRDATTLAGRATKEALKGILGFATPKPVITVEKEIIEAEDVKVETPVVTETEEEETEEEEEIVEERSYAQKTQDFVNSLSTGQKVIGAIVGGAVVVGGLYLITPPALRGLAAVGRGILWTGCGTTKIAGKIANGVTFGLLSNNTVTNWVASTRLANICA